MYYCLPNRRPGLNKRPGGNCLKSNKRPALNKCPGTKFSSEFSVVATYYLTFFTYFDVSLPQWNSCWEICEKLIIVLPLIRVSWEENWRKIIRMSWTTIREIRVSHLFFKFLYAELRCNFFPFSKKATCNLDERYSSLPNSSPGHSYYFWTIFLPGHPY